jgi:hypothetical protein
MDRNILVYGSRTKLMDKDNCCMLMVTYTMDNGLTTRPMGRERTFMQMAHSMMAIGSKINSMASARRHGQTELSMKGNITMGRSMGEAN